MVDWNSVVTIRDESVYKANPTVKYIVDWLWTYRTWYNWRLPGYGNMSFNFSCPKGNAQPIPSLPSVRVEIPASFTVHRRENWRIGPMTFKIEPAGLRTNYCDTTDLHGHHRDNYCRFLQFQIKPPSALRNVRWWKLFFGVELKLFFEKTTNQTLPKVKTKQTSWK